MSAPSTQSPEERAEATRATFQRTIENEGTQRKNSEDQALNRACEACRVSKVRCLASLDPSSAQCQRCAKAGKVCIFAPPIKRRQRKRTDVRVAELEKEVMKMRDLMKSSNRPLPPSSEQGSESDEQESGAKDSSMEPGGRRASTRTTSTLAHHPPTVPTDTERRSPLRIYEPRDPLRYEESDIVERNVIDAETAQSLLNTWRNKLTYACPGIILNNDWTAAHLRKQKPLLFHAVMAASSHSQGSALSDALEEEAVYLIARSAFINGFKSVECVQALLVLVAYYSPPKTIGQIQIYSWVNMAASMALELGLASKPRTHEQLPRRAVKSLQRISSPEELLEHCRTVLYLYVVCAGFSMRLKRPNILLFNSWMEECVGILEKSQLLDDKRTLAWLKLQRIADEANTAFGFDDASTSFSLSELRMQMILRIFDRRMQDWKNSIPAEVQTLSLTIEYHQNILSMWEFGMDGGRYDVTDFRNRHLTLPALDDDDCVQPESLLSRSALQINATTKCISEAHAILEAFLSVPSDHFQSVPNIIFVRATYALVSLLKADYAVGTDKEMGSILDSQSLKVDYYLAMVIQKIQDAVGPQECRIPMHWHSVISRRLQSWRTEYLDWKSRPRPLKRRKTKDAAGDAADTHHATAAVPAASFPTPHPNPLPDSLTQQPATSLLPPSTSTSPTHLTHPYNLASTAAQDPYAAWPPQSRNTAAAAATTTTTTTAFTPDMGDFARALQTGDLYLWNDIGDNFGSWMPQGSGMYGDLGFEIGGAGF